MLSKEDYEEMTKTLRGKLDETSSALISEEILSLLSAYNGGYDELDELKQEVDKLKTEKEELLKVNGKLYQQIGFDKEEKEDETIDKNEDEEELSIEDIIDEKGELI